MRSPDIKTVKKIIKNKVINLLKEKKSNLLIKKRKGINKDNLVIHMPMCGLLKGPVSLSSENFSLPNKS